MNLARQLFDSWVGPDKVDKSLLSPGFVFDGSICTEVWLDSDNEDLVLNARIIALAANDAGELLMFEFVDPITLLEHRVAWYVKINDGLIERVIEVSQTIPKMVRD